MGRRLKADEGDEDSVCVRRVIGDRKRGLNQLRDFKGQKLGYWLYPVAEKWRSGDTEDWSASDPLGAVH